MLRLDALAIAMMREEEGPVQRNGGLAKWDSGELSRGLQRFDGSGSGNGNGKTEESALLQPL